MLVCLNKSVDLRQVKCNDAAPSKTFLSQSWRDRLIKHNRSKERKGGKHRTTQDDTWTKDSNKQRGQQQKKEGRAKAGEGKAEKKRNKKGGEDWRKRTNEEGQKGTKKKRTKQGKGRAARTEAEGTTKKGRDMKYAKISKTDIYD